REIRPVPVLLLTAKAEADARIAGLEAGADDYLVKPFEPRELLLRISNILRRADTPKTPVIEQVVFGPYSFSLARRELKKGATPIRLTEREQDILAMLAEKAGETVARYDLVSSASEINERTIDVQINRLRRKIENDPANPVYLQTVRGIGYRLSRD
ncbi:MAG: response regulator transcription factor, partial [Martelella sp.]